MDVWLNGWMDELVTGWIVKLTGKLMDGWMGCMGGRMVGWMYGWIDGWMDA